jgi:hypothetical protein
VNLDRPAAFNAVVRRFIEARCKGS